METLKEMTTEQLEQAYHAITGDANEKINAQIEILKAFREKLQEKYLDEELKSRSGFIIDLADDIYPDWTDDSWNKMEELFKALARATTQAAIFTAFMDEKELKTFKARYQEIQD